MAQAPLLDLVLNISAQTAELTKGISEANNKLDGFSKGVSKIGGMIAGAFTATAIIGAGKAVFEFANEIGKATDKVATLTKLTGDELTKTTAKVKAVSETFDKDFNTVLESAQTVAREFGLSMPEALDMVQKGLSVTGLKGDEFLDILKEYPSQFASMGTSADQFFALTAKGLQEGAFGDKYNDAIKEAGLRLRELPASTETALAAIGIYGKDIQAQIRNGSLSTFEAVQLVSRKLNEFKGSSQEVGKVLADVFGGAGEDLGIRLVRSIAAGNEGLDQMVKNAGGVAEAQIRLSSASAELNEVWVDLFGGTNTLVTNIKANLIEVAAKSLVAIKKGVIETANYFINLYNQSLPFRGVVQGLVFYFRQMWEAVKLVGSLIINTFSSSGKIIAAIFKGEFSSIPGLYKDAIQGIVDAGVEYGKNTFEAFKEGVDNAVNAKPLELISDATVTQAQSQLAKIKPSEVLAASTGGAPSRSLSESDKGFMQNTGLRGSASQALSPTVNMEGGGDVFASMTESVEQFRAKMAITAEEYKKHQDEMAARTQMAEGAFNAMFSEVEAGGQSFSDMAKSAANAFKKIIKGYIAEAIAGAVAKSLASAPFPFNVLLGAAAGAAASALLNKLIPSYAAGTGPGGHPGGMAIVGERGPELWSNLPPGHIINNKDTMKMFNGGNYSAGQQQLVAVVTGDQLNFVLQETKRRK